MITAFAPLFTLEAGHDYYTDGRCRDFAFVLANSTRADLQRARLVAKEFDGRLHVFFQADATGKPLVTPTNLTLRLGLRLTNTNFDNFTKAGLRPGSVVAVYDNRADSGTLGQPVLAAVSGTLLRHTLTRPTRPVDVRLLSSSNALVASASIGQDPARDDVSFEMSGQVPGLYTVEETYAPASTATTLHYMEPVFARSSVLAIVDVAVTSALYQGAPAYRVAFEPRVEPLRYYVVARNYAPADVASLAVTDAGADGRPAVQFDRILSDAFTDRELPAALLATPGDQVVLFQSTTPLNRLEAGRQRLQLRRNGDVLVANLPQPGADRPASDLVVHLSKPKT